MTIHTIHPYRDAGWCWVFDDPARGLSLEPFVYGADEIIDEATKDLPGAAAGFTLTFSDAPFTGYQFSLEWAGHEKIGGLSGNWYYEERLELAGWLCPALLAYFDLAPRTIYAAVS